MSDNAYTNAFGQPIGAPVPGWQPRPAPPRTPAQGRFCRIEPVDPGRHADDLHAAYATAADGRDWTYMSAGPFADAESYRAYLRKAAETDDPLHHAIVDLATGKAVGTFALMRADRANGAIEVGFVAYSPLLQKTCAGTEALFLLMRRVFDELGYRRFEWKCDSLNAPSRAAALRYGFTYEGCSGRRSSTRGARATPRGIRSSTANGRRCARRSSSGSRPGISTRTAVSGSRCRR